MSTSNYLFPHTKSFFSLIYFITKLLNTYYGVGRAREEERKRRESELLKQRRPSRFEVTPAPDILRVKQLSNHELDSGLQVPYITIDLHYI